MNTKKIAKFISQPWVKWTAGITVGTSAVLAAIFLSEGVFFQGNLNMDQCALLKQYYLAGTLDKVIANGGATQADVKYCETAFPNMWPATGAPTTQSPTSAPQQNTTGISTQNTLSTSQQSPTGASPTTAPTSPTGAAPTDPTTSPTTPTTTEPTAPTEPTPDQTQPTTSASTPVDTTTPTPDLTKATAPTSETTYEKNPAASIKTMMPTTESTAKTTPTTPTGTSTKSPSAPIAPVVSPTIYPAAPTAPLALVPPITTTPAAPIVSRPNIYTGSTGATGSTGTTSGSSTSTQNTSTSSCEWFTDVPTTSKFYTAIKYVYDQGIFAGYPDCTFRPNDVINRAEAVKVILLGFQKSISTTGKIAFPDISTNDWFHNYVLSGQKMGIVIGYPDGNFKPAKQLTRAEMVKIFINSSPLAAKVNYTSNHTGICPDMTGLQRSAWFIPFFEVAVNYGLVPEGACHADVGMTRGDVANLYYLLGKSQQ